MIKKLVCCRIKIITIYDYSKLSNNIWLWRCVPKPVAQRSWVRSPHDMNVKIPGLELGRMGGYRFVRRIGAFRCDVGTGLLRHYYPRFFTHTLPQLHIYSLLLLLNILNRGPPKWYKNIKWITVSRLSGVRRVSKTTKCKRTGINVDTRNEVWDHHIFENNVRLLSL